MLAVFVSASTMLQKGMSLLGSVRLECLNQMWWKLRKIRASVGTTCDPGVVDLSSEDDLSDTPPPAPPEKRGKLTEGDGTQEHHSAHGRHRG